MPRAMPTLIPTAKRIKELLHANGLTRQQTADLCDAPIHTVHGWYAPEDNTSRRAISGSSLRLQRLYAPVGGWTLRDKSRAASVIPTFGSSISHWEPFLSTNYIVVTLPT